MSEMSVARVYRTKQAKNTKSNTEMNNTRLRDENRKLRFSKQVREQ